jgi:hypothetical protein
MPLENWPDPPCEDSITCEPDAPWADKIIYWLPSGDDYRIESLSNLRPHCDASRDDWKTIWKEWKDQKRSYIFLGDKHLSRKLLVRPARRQLLSLYKTNNPHLSLSPSTPRRVNSCGPSLRYRVIEASCEQMKKKRRQNPALDSSPSSWLRSNPQFYAGEVSRALLYAETLLC